MCSLKEAYKNCQKNYFSQLKKFTIRGGFQQANSEIL